MTQPASAPALPANVRVFEMAASAVAARALWGAAELGVADALDNDPRPVDELAVLALPTPARSTGCCGCWRRMVSSSSTTDGASPTPR